MDKLSNAILCERDERKLPVYSIKSRVKRSESAYLKTKRKNYTSLDQITDCAGMRVLCLFERDIFDVNDFILKYIKSEDITVSEIKIFNFDSTSCDKINKTIYELSFVESQTLNENKKSGYKSIHYSMKIQFGSKPIMVELQLRTLLQDVWGELEHSLSYKRGAVHPHIKKSFELLSYDLQTTDSLMEHLRDINDKEESGERYSNDKSGPRDYFDYEDDLLPGKFLTTLKNEFESYRSFMKGVDFRDKKNYSDNVFKARGMYNEIVSKLNGTDLKDKKVKYWHDMENAFLLFCEAEYEEALGIYTGLITAHKDKYCLYFRVGEIYVKLGKIEKALPRFDESEILIHTSSEYDKKNLYHIKVMLALVYWLLGDEYINIALKEILEVENLYNNNKDILSDSVDTTALANNMCWYHLSKFIITQSESDFIAAQERFLPLENMILEDIDNKLSCNSLDTAAWFYYNRFLYKKDRADADKAIECCIKMKDRFNYTSFNFSSIHVQFSHIKEIMNLSREHHSL